MADAAPVTAAVLIIGNEILSGGTQDRNLSWLATALGNLGIRVPEARMVRDDTDAIVASVRALAARHRYLFTTGGIGPTHDDITHAAIAAAFGRRLVRHAEAASRLEAYYAGRDLAVNEARLRMAEAAEGAELLTSPASGSLTFRVENVFALAGIPSIMQAQFAGLAPTLAGGERLLTRTIACRLTEGEFAAALGALQQAHGAVEIGSYPNARGRSPATRIVLTAVSEYAMKEAADAVRQMLAERGGDPVEESPENRGETEA